MQHFRRMPPADRFSFSTASGSLLKHSQHADSNIHIILASYRAEETRFKTKMTSFVLREHAISLTSCLKQEKNRVLRVT
jgi:hypothetical protein